MRMPRFTAEAALAASERYQTGRAVSQANGRAIHPAAGEYECIERCYFSCMAYYKERGHLPYERAHARCGDRCAQRK